MTLRQCSLYDSDQNFSVGLNVGRLKGGNKVLFTGKILQNSSLQINQLNIQWIEQIWF